MFVKAFRQWPPPDTARRHGCCETCLFFSGCTCLFFLRLRLPFLSRAALAFSFSGCACLFFLRLRLLDLSWMLRDLPFASWAGHGMARRVHVAIVDGRPSFSGCACSELSFSGCERDCPSCRSPCAPFLALRLLVCLNPKQRAALAQRSPTLIARYLTDAHRSLPR